MGVIIDRTEVRMTRCARAGSTKGAADKDDRRAVEPRARAAHVGKACVEGKEVDVALSAVVRVYREAAPAARVWASLHAELVACAGAAAGEEEGKEGRGGSGGVGERMVE